MLLEIFLTPSRINVDKSEKYKAHSDPFLLFKARTAILYIKNIPREASESSASLKIISSKVKIRPPSPCL